VTAGISLSSDTIGGNLPREYAALYSQVFPDRTHRLQGCFPVHRTFLLAVIQLGAQRAGVVIDLPFAPVTSSSDVYTLSLFLSFFERLRPNSRFLPMSLIGNIRHGSWFRGVCFVGLDVARPELA